MSSEATYIEVTIVYAMELLYYVVLLVSCSCILFPTSVPYFLEPYEWEFPFWVVLSFILLHRDCLKGSNLTGC